MFELQDLKNSDKTQAYFFKENFTICFKKKSEAISIKILVNTLDNPPHLQLN
jgi:hypothetical protein